MKLFALLSVLALMPVVACSGDDGEGGSSSGGSSSSSSGNSTDGGGSSGASSGNSSSGSVACTAVGRTVLADEPKQISALSATSSKLVFLATEQSATLATTIDTANLDGSGRTTLYAPTGADRVIGARAAGDDVVFLLEDTSTPVPAPELYKVSASGGTPVRVGGETFREGRLYASTAQYIYIVRNTTTPVGSVYERVDLASGATVQMASSPASTGTPVQVGLAQNETFFIAGVAGAGNNPQDIYRFDVTLTGQTASKVFPGGLRDLCSSVLDGLYATPTKLGCGFSALKASNRDGSEITELVAADVLKPTANRLVATDAEFFYVYDSSNEAPNTAGLYKVNSAGGDRLPIACDVGAVQNRMMRGTFPIAPEFEVFVHQADVWWVEVDATAKSWSIRATQK